MTTATELIRELQSDPALAAQVRGGLLGEELLSLPALVRELVISLDRMVERQDRTEERQGRMEETLTRLAEAQARTEANLETLTVQMDRGFRELRAEVGHLNERFGATAEQEAADLLMDALEAAGYTLEGEPTYLRFDGHELEALARARRPGDRAVTALVEPKVRLGHGDVVKFAHRVRDPGFRARLTEAGYPGPWLAYVYGMRIEQRAEDAARTEGIGLVRHPGGPAALEPVALPA